MYKKDIKTYIGSFDVYYYTIQIYEKVQPFTLGMQMLHKS